MKIVCIYLVCFMAVALAKVVDISYEESSKFLKNLRDCIKETGVEIINKEDGGFTDREPVKGCFAFCVKKKQGIMNEDGTVNKDLFIQSEYEDQSGAELIFNHCQKTVQPGDGCKMAQCLSINDNNIKLSLD